MCLRRFVYVLLLSLLFLSPAFSQAPLQQKNDLWNSIDWNLNFLEQEQLLSQTRLLQLEKKLEESEKACQDKDLQLLNFENLLEKSEQDTRKWKNCSLVLGTVSVTVTVTAILMMVFKK